MDDGEHLLVQAGTGTGKSLAYLVRACSTTSGSWSPPRRSPCSTSSSSATSRGWSRRSATGVDASYAVLKGRSNYACLHRIREGVPDDQGALVDVPEGSMGEQGPRAAGVGRGGGRGRRQRRARQRAAAHRPRVAPGQRQPPRVPGRREVPVRRGVLRRAGPREGAAQPPDRHQPLAARDRRDRGRADDPRVRRRGHRRGPRAGRPGHPGRDRRARRRPTSSGRPRRSQRYVEGDEADDLADAGRRAGRRRSRRPRPGRIDDVPDAARATRWCWSATRPRACLSAYPKETRRRGRRRRPHPGQGLGAGGLRQSPSGWPPTSSPTCSGSPRAATGIPPRLLRRAAPGVGADARQAAHRQDGRLHQRDPDARRRLQRRRHQRRAQADRAVRRRPVAAPTTCCPGAGSTSGRPFDYGQQAILYVARHLPPPGPRRPRRGPARRDRRAGRRRRRAAPSGCSRQPPGGRDRGRGGPRAAART